MDRLITMLRAAGDSTRLRLLFLLLDAELTVTELTQILGQSQPRVSRHLKLLCGAGLLQRFKEGAWVFYRAADSGPPAVLTRALTELRDGQDEGLAADRRMLAQVRAARAAAAAVYFKTNASRWERIRSLHVPEADVENAIVGALKDRRLESVLDAGTGTGRILELLSPHIGRGVGLDISPDMLALARDRLMKSGIANCQVRLGDVYRLPFPDAAAGQGFDAVIFHQVLHFLDDPQAALREALRVLNPGGGVLIADFAPHDLEFLRSDHAHRRLGFSDHEVQSWFGSIGFKPEAVRSLAPRSGDEKLTVMVWLATAPGVPSRRARTEDAA